ncbi:TetR/AcrR family transcriptional regulator [Clavibacter michiganensis]|uniref:TetR/AcrR family transcriptional regulator n=1 Tax=Clavibacter michiganensis TaxID=28447 RepID=UPI001BE07BE5|nr:TetR/AcrR family transcriptional regulator [Clavibacter michiganensis]MBT1636990.1 TetR/AcrR family transcriptional regulator [Clavibacter michiganensis]
MDDDPVDGRRLRYAHRRGELLRAATEHVLEHGLDDLTLRGLADGVGVSHATLVHHFATRDGLIAEIVERVLAETFSSPDLVTGAEDPLRALWARATAPEGRRHVRLFVAITGRSMHGDPPFADAVARSLRDRTALVAGALEAAGRPSAEASAAATVILGVMRGLMVDLLLTGESARVDAAFAAFVAGQARAAG